MPNYTSPGVYYERVDASTPAIGAVRTDIAGFVGIAERGPIDMAVPVESWRQFSANFGGFTGSAYLAYSVRAFFENGGKRCWVVRVASRDGLGGAQPASTVISDGSGAAAWQVQASSPGSWGSGLTIEWQEIHRGQTVTIPGQPAVMAVPTSNVRAPVASPVASVAGFGRASMVRLTQLGATQIKVVSDVDPITNSLIWVSDSPISRLPYDSPLTGFDPNKPIFIETIEYQLIVNQPGMQVSVYRNLSLIPENPNYGPVAMPPYMVPADAINRGLLAPPPLPVTIVEMRTLPLDDVIPLQIDPDATLSLSGGTDGLALLSTYDFIGEEPTPWDSDLEAAAKRRGILVIGAVEEVAIVAVPDIQIQPELPALFAPPRRCVPDPCLPNQPRPTPGSAPAAATELPPVFPESAIYTVQAALVQMCEALADRIALIEPPVSAVRDSGDALSRVRAWRSRFDSKYAALYYPWLRVVDPLRNASDSLTRDIPPSGHVAGQYANTDLTVGVHKAPANNQLQWIQDTTFAINDALGGLLNPLGVNAIRTFPGRGIRIYGARTVTSDTSWIYVNVRRLLMMIEKSIYLSTQWAVFEPNNDLTRIKINLSLTSFLVALWQQGALMGGTPQAAFYVTCDASNNPQSTVDNGQLFADVGVAPSQPFEFVVLRLGRIDNSFEVTQVGS